MGRIECDLILSLSAPREYSIASRSIILLSVRIRACRNSGFQIWAVFRATEIELSDDLQNYNMTSILSLGLAQPQGSTSNKIPVHGHMTTYLPAGVRPHSLRIP